MDDSSLFLQWAVNTLQHHDDGAFPSLQVLREASQPVSGGGGELGCVRSMSPSLAPRGIPPTSWNFAAVSARPSGGTLDLDVTPDVAATIPAEMVYESQPTRRASAGTGPASAAYGQGHIMAERRRREKINQRFIELSALIPGLKKMDKGTILTEAFRHVKELQERVKSLEAAAGASNGKSIQAAVVLVKKACVAAAARSPLPEVEAKLSGNNVMVRIHCENGKGLVVRVLAEAEELHLRIVNSNVMPFTASTVVITIMAKVQEGFTVKAEEIVGSLNSAIHQHSSSR